MTQGQPEAASRPEAPQGTPKATQPPKQAEKEPVMIRKAILPSKEELERMKQGHVQNEIGQLPNMTIAAPLKSASN